MNKFNYFQSFKIKASDVDKNSRIKLFELVNYMQELAWNHAASLGFSTHSLLAKNISWILNQQYFEFYNTPKHGDLIKIETWPAGMDKFFAYRNFNIFDSEDNLILRSYSKWLMLDIIARKMISIPDDIAFSALNFERNKDEHRFERIKIGKPIAESAFPVTVGWSDLDVNGHINNAIYFKWLTDALNEETLNVKSLKKLKIIFKSEGILNESLVSECWNINKNATQHRITNIDTQKDLIVAELEFNNN